MGSVLEWRWHTKAPVDLGGRSIQLIQSEIIENILKKKKMNRASGSHGTKT